jgi:hypothetical protein
MDTIISSILCLAISLMLLIEKQLPTRDIVVNMDGGVGGSWEEVEYIEVGNQKIATQQKLPQNCQEPFIPNLHD